MLLLFDIDGTLVSGAAHAHAVALRDALHTVHRVDAGQVRQTIELAGRTDGEIARLILLGAGIAAAAIDERAGDVRAECCRRYAELLDEDLSDTVLPGNRELLEWLCGVPGVRLSLATGNFEPVARLKLKAAGLVRFFAAGQGGFGSDSEDRTALPALARQRAGRDGIPYPRRRTIVIGDTPRDILCARADGVRCFAVSTGPFAAAQLAEADAVAADAGELRALLEHALLGDRSLRCDDDRQ